MRIAVVDTMYPQFLNSLQRSADYADALKFTLSRFFGTFDAYSRHLRMLAHDTLDIIANDSYLQNLWSTEHGVTGMSLKSVALAQIEDFKPDVVFMQDLSFFDSATLEFLRRKYVLAGQCSCPFPDPQNVSKFHVLFTSFPHYVDRFEALGVHGVYLPLAFDPIVLERTYIPEFRSHVSFVGGRGRHWETDKLFSALAEHTPMEFYGYGYENAPQAVRNRYLGNSWGLSMYETYLGSTIVLNRHGGVAEGYANNLRMFEATGCGALLVTEYAPNLTDFFSDTECVTYSSVDEAVERINYYVSHPIESRAIAAAGQERTIHEHTYFQRMPKVSEVLTECLSKA